MHAPPVMTVLVCLGITAQAPPPPGNAAARAKTAYSRALDLEQQGNAQAALSLLWEAAGLAPHDPDITNRLGEALERIGALDAAVDAFRRAIADRPGFRQASNNLILALVKAGRGPDAREYARALIAAAPGDPDAYFALGLAQSEQDVAEAISTFRRVLQLSPRHALARFNLALVLKRSDRIPEAIEQLREALSIEPRGEARYTLGVIYWQQGELERAASELREAVILEPRYVDAYHTLGAVLAERRDWKSASDALRRAIALRPELTGAHYTLARVLQQSGDAAGGRQHLAEAERLRERGRLEQEASVWTSTGTQKLEAGDASGAVAHFRRAIGVFEAYAPAHYQLGRALQVLGQPDASRAAFHRAQQLNPSLVPPPNAR